MADITATVPGFPANLCLQKVTIASGASKTEMIATQGYALVGIMMPATWTAADIGYEANWEGNPNSFVPVYTGSGAASTTTATASKWIAFPTVDAIYANYIKLTSVTAGGGSVTPVNQGAARELVLVFRKLFS